MASRARFPYPTHPSLTCALALSGLLWLPAAAADITFSDDLSDLTPQERAWLEGDGPRPDVAQSMKDNHQPMTVTPTDDFPTRFENEALVWLSPEQVQKDAYYLVNHLTVTPSSLKDGWVEFEQCHHQLDAINKVEVVYNPDNTRNLSVTQAQGIGQTNTLTASVVLKQVSAQAHVCIEGESQTLNKTQDQQWQLTRGPYMRKFFNGYYPMHLQENLSWDPSQISLTQPSPTIENQPSGRQYTHQSGQLKAAYWFEGALRPVYRFSAVETSQQ